HRSRWPVRRRESVRGPNPAYAHYRPQMHSHVTYEKGTGGQPGIEIQLFSDHEFPVRNEIMVLQIGARQFSLSGYPNGDLNTVVFTPTEEEFAAVSCGEAVIVQYDIAPSDEVWQFGN